MFYLRSASLPLSVNWWWLHYLIIFLQVYFKINWKLLSLTCILISPRLHTVHCFFPSSSLLSFTVCHVIQKTAKHSAGMIYKTLYSSKNNTVGSALYGPLESHEAPKQTLDQIRESLLYFCQLQECLFNTV